MWRRLEFRSDLTLDVVHRAIQASYAWLDCHLHRFSLGGGPFEFTSELFLCPFDVTEGEDEGSPADEVRLDETMHEPGDTLHYVYDYGDDWRLTLRLEEITALTDDASPVRCVDGERAAPPEDCGHLVDAADLARVLDDPAHFNVDAVNVALNDPIEPLGTAGVDRRLHQLLRQLRRTE
ncbi:plasmid pRiA4b ORF-3 family protein [Gordonia bronchialis]|uniref:plasmid pRiA4b ORF-3 family protein n=1 Tax=Gordonia bronchialis TaxID=2054 RepID=UPI002271952C|nr:plasmid pRiA4b ORF-3 family protein [Gordonia bronchialis]